MLQPDPYGLPHGLVVAFLFPPLLVFLQDDTVDEAQALAESSMQQLHLLLCAGLLCLVGQGDDASSVWGVAHKEALSLFLNVAKQTNNRPIFIDNLLLAQSKSSADGDVG